MPQSTTDEEAEEGEGQPEEQPQWSPNPERKVISLKQQLAEQAARHAEERANLEAFANEQAETLSRVAAELEECRRNRAQRRATKKPSKAKQKRKT